MSGIILTSYHRYLNDREIQLSDQVDEDMEFWKESDKNETERQLKEFAKYNPGDTIQFSYPYGFRSLKQQKLFEADSCIAKGIVMNKNIVNYLIQVKIIQTCDKKGIIYYDSDKTLIYDNQQHKYIKPQFRTKKVIKIGHEYWCNYADWEPN